MSFEESWENKKFSSNLGDLNHMMDVMKTQRDVVILRFYIQSN